MSRALARVFAPSILRGTMAAAAWTSFACAPATQPGAPVPSPGEHVYVANEASGVVSVVDVRTGTVQVVDLRAMGFGDNPRPHHVVVEPDGTRWYVSLIGANRVLAFDAANRLVGSATFETPGLLALGETGELWVGRSMSAVNAPSRLGRVDLSDMGVEEPDVFVAMPHALATDPQGRWVFTGGMHETAVVRLDPVTDRAEVSRLDAGATSAHGLAHYAISPDGRTLVATADQMGLLLVFDVGSPPEVRLLREVAVGPLPWHPAFTTDGREVWVTNMGSDEVSVVDATTWSVVAVVRGEGLAEPHGLIVSPDGTRVYVSSGSSSGEYAGTT
jgi:YVTN family beta-propeller protein